MQDKQVDTAADAIRAEFERTPGLRLTFWQTQRLWDLPAGLCERALTLLVRSNYLISNIDGTYLRRPDTAAQVQSIEAMLRAM